MSNFLGSFFYVLTGNFILFFENIVVSAHLSTAVAWREKICKHFAFYKYFCLVLGLLKSRIWKKNLWRALGENPILSFFTIRLGYSQ